MSDFYIFKSAKVKEKFVPINIEEKNKKEKKDRELKDLNSYKQQANRYIIQAKNKADIILKSAKKQAEDIFLKAYKEGYKKGYLEANEVLKKEYEDKINQLNQDFLQLMQTLVNEKQSYLKKLEKEFLVLSLVIARKITNSYIKSNSNVVLANIKKGLNYLIDKTAKIEILLSKRDFEFVSNLLEDKKIDFLSDLDIKLIEDLKLDDGSCIIRDAKGLQVDLTLDKQMQNIYRQLSQLYFSDEL